MGDSRKKRIGRVKSILRYILLILILLILAFILKNIFYPKTSYLCPDNVTMAEKAEDCKLLEESELGVGVNESVGNESDCYLCDDNNMCTEDICSEETGYKCIHKVIVPCLSNGICEMGEYGTTDCPNCNDWNECTVEDFDYEKGECVHTMTVLCCGNGICELNESYVNCKKDCAQLLNLEIVHYSKETTIKDFFSDLSGSEKTFLVVRFKLTNLGVENAVTMITGESGTGYYFDPFKIKVKDAEGNYHSPEYDSDLLPNYRDYTILRKGQRVEGQLAYIIPKSLTKVNLVAQSQEEVDLAEIPINLY